MVPRFLVYSWCREFFRLQNELSKLLPCLRQAERIRDYGQGRKICEFRDCYGFRVLDFVGFVLWLRALRGLAVDVHRAKIGRGRVV